MLFISFPAVFLYFYLRPRGRGIAYICICLLNYLFYVVFLFVLADFELMQLKHNGSALTYDMNGNDQLELFYN